MKKRESTAAAWLLAAAILTLSGIFLLSPKKEFSENENRYLAAFPKWSWEQVKSGAYMKDLEQYFSDQFPFRDFFMGCKTAAEMAMGRREIGGVYIGKDHFLIEAYEKPRQTEQIARTFSDFREKLSDLPVELRLMLVPTAITVYEDRLPVLAPRADQMETARIIEESSGIAGVPCLSQLLQHKEEGQLYYRTDHHWTTYGAYVGYAAYGQAAGLSVVPLEEWEGELVTEEFRGTIYSKVHDYGQKGDSITIYRHPEDRLTVRYLDTGKVTDTLYNLDYVSQKDQYSLFLDNLHTQIEITNEAAETDRELVLIKDSYANSMVPFLAHHFKRIYVFDTRYYKMGPSSFIRENPSVTDVLILYNLNTLDQDLGVRGIY